MLKNTIQKVAKKFGYKVSRLHRNRTRSVQNELARLRGLPAGVPTETNLLGRPLRIPCPQTFEYLYAEIWEREIYRLPQQKRSNRVIDGGANIGMATLFLKTHFPDLEITAIEADPRIAEMLRFNLSSFGFPDVVVINAALAATKGSVSFVQESGGTSGRIGSGGGTVTVPAIQLSSLLSAPIEFLKLDIEGAEAGVIQEALPHLHCVRFLFLEYHSTIGQAQHLGEMLNALKNQGFRYVLEHGGRIADQPFVKNAEHKGMDNLVNIYARRD